MDLDNYSEHDLIVLSLVEVLKKDKFTNIKADLPNHERPKEIFLNDYLPNYIPDVTADEDDSSYIFKVETANSLSEEHSHKQWITFYTFAELTKSTFVLVIPIGKEDEARDLLSKKNILAEIWTAE